MRDQPEDMRQHSEPPAPTWAKNGSFLVYRRLRQDVVAFQKFLATASAMLPTKLLSLTNLNSCLPPIGTWQMQGAKGGSVSYLFNAHA